MSDYLSGAPEVVLAFAKVTGLKVIMGVMGTAVLYLAVPPIDKDGHFDRREFFYRLCTAGLFSSVFGDMAVGALANALPFLNAQEYPAAVYLMVGAPGWWVSRIIATTLRRREGRDIPEVLDEIKGHQD
jgi:hypothetical protein